VLCAGAVAGVVESAVGSVAVAAVKERWGRCVGLLDDDCVHRHGVVV
jgi:hypothetical protein